MENNLTTTADLRLANLKTWLRDAAQERRLDLDTLQSASSDASFRRYYRVQAPDATYIVMDAPPEHENTAAFVHVTQLLEPIGVNVPRIFAKDLTQGFLLLSDLGNQTYYQAVQENVTDAQLQVMYRSAIGALVRIQQAGCANLPVYDTDRLLQELEVFTEWYAARHCQVTLDEKDLATLQGVFDSLVADNAAQPSVFVHRDFHSPNLMVDQGSGEPGIIDYQDALIGPITYDIASLVMDARQTWEEPQQLDWAIRYWEAANAAGLPVPDDFADFHRAYEWMGLQRNLRILGVFARLSYRDNKHHYLDHIPRVNGYVRQVAGRYNAFRPLLRVLDKLENRAAVTGYTF